jgi:hypothetical protein
MTGHDDVDAARDRIDLQSLQIVQNVDRLCRKSHDLFFRAATAQSSNPRFLGSR